MANGYPGIVQHDMVSSANKYVIAVPTEGRKGWWHSSPVRISTAKAIADDSILTAMESCLPIASPPAASPFPVFVMLLDDFDDVVVGHSPPLLDDDTACARGRGCSPLLNEDVGAAA